MAADNASSRNESVIFKYLTEDMGLNIAAACGVLANIQAESSFMVTAEAAMVSANGIMNVSLH